MIKFPVLLYREELCAKVQNRFDPARENNTILLFADDDGSRAIKYNVLDEEKESIIYSHGENFINVSGPTELVPLKYKMWVLQLTVKHDWKGDPLQHGEWEIALGDIFVEDMINAEEDHEMCIDVVHYTSKDKLWMKPPPAYLCDFINNAVEILKTCAVNDSWCVLEGDGEKDDRMPFIDIMKHNYPDYVDTINAASEDRIIIIENMNVSAGDLASSFCGPTMMVRIGSIEDKYDSNVVLLPYDPDMVHELALAFGKLHIEISSGLISMVAEEG